jgi:hypothetical protein
LRDAQARPLSSETLAVILSAAKPNSSIQVDASQAHLVRHERVSALQPRTSGGYMKRTLWMTAAIACATSVALMAQSPSTTTSQSSDKKTVTVTGCVQDSSAGSAASSTTTGSSTTGGGFILANATMGSGSMAGSTPGSTAGTTAGTTSGTTASTPPTSATTGTAGTTGSSSSMSHNYKLEGSDSELKRHVGHKVEVTGTIDGASHSTSSATSTTGTTSSSSSTMNNEQKIEVSSVRMISADCSSK